MAINQNDKVIRQIMVGDKAHEVSAKYLNDHTYDEIEQDIKDSCDEIRNNLLSPIYYYSNPKLDIKDETNNVYCYGYVGSLKNINVYGDFILIDSISVYVRENDNTKNLDTPVWCRLLKFVNNTWETVYQSTESKTIRGIAPETLFSFKMRAIDDTNDTNKLIRSTDKIAIVYVDSEDAQVLSGVELGFKAILNTGGGLQNPLANNSTGNSGWCPAFSIGYLTDNPINPGETFEGSMDINNGDININNKTTISSEIDSGELKVRHYGTTKGFIIRTNNKDENANSDIFPLEILTTNNNFSYQYNFPKQNGDVLLYKKVTYSELVGLKNNSQLVPGGVYRISDYATYTSAGLTSSAGNLFDILVVAISKNELSENANACLHDGDTYFSANGAKLDSWEIKYCIDNDATRFQWINGTATNRKGVIYYMKDEWGNEAPYDFKNILFNKNGVNYYTFSFSNNGSIEDATVTTKNVYDNKILPFYDLGDKNMILNRNTFLLTNNQHQCVSNYIGQNCKSNTFGSNCICNTLESYCNDNTFGDNCQYNEFAEYCTDNAFGDYCQSNVFGVNCTYNKFGSYILRCNIGNKCSYCKITNNSGDNGTLLSYVKMVEFGDECSNVNLWTDNTDSGYVQNYKITNGLSGSIKITGDNIRGRNYQTIIGNTRFDSDINLAGKTIIKNGSDIDNGEFKVFKANDSTSGFTIRTNNKFDTNIPKLEMLATNNNNSYKYQFPKLASLDATDYVVVKSQLDEVIETVQENERVAANALTYLNGNYEDMRNELDNLDVDVDSLIEVTYSELVEMRDSSKLTPGKKYRITDYVTTTSQENTVSANHVFDVIVEALSENTLSENAKAIQHENDGYFDESNLEAWELKYCLNNDSERFVWAVENKTIVTENYRIKPELINGNTFIVPFTFDGQILIDTAEFVYENGKEDDIIYEWGYETEPNGEDSLYIIKNGVGYENEGMDYNDKHYYRGTINIEGEIYDKWEKCEGNENEYYVSDAGGVYFLTKSIVEEGSSEITIGGKGVIYYMKDEYNNECPYDFKNIQFVRYKLNPPTVGGYNNEWQNKLSENVNEMFENNRLSYIWHGSNSEGYYWDENGAVFSTATEETKAFYTFSNVINDEITDKSLINVCYSNVIKEGYENKVLKLNNNIFFSEYIDDYCYNNSFGNDCYSNSFGNDCYYNSFGNGCFSNSFDNDCCSNSFGNSCCSNSFGNSFYSNSFGNTCYSNSFGNFCCSNSFGNGCFSNSFGNDCYSNSFGNNCYYNSFGNNCNSNSFGNECHDNSFGDSCNDNSFGNSCHDNSFGNACNSNSLGNSCASNTLGNECNGNVFGNDCEYNSLDTNCKYNSFSNNCDSNSFGIDCYNNIFSNSCYSNTFGDKCYGNAFGNYCYSNIFGNDCYNNSFGNSCYSNSFANECNGNAFDNYCYSNSFGDKCYGNSFGNSCNSNIFGNSCKSNSFGITCTNNSFSYSCTNNIFGNACDYIIFGNYCNSNSFGDTCKYNSFGDTCHSNSFGTDCHSNSFGDSCDFNSFANDCHNNSFGNSFYSNSFDNSCYSNSFGDTCTNNSFGNTCYSNSFGNSCKYNSFGDTCNDNSFGNSCYSNSFGNSCQHNGFYVGSSYTNQGNTGYIVNSEKLNYVKNITISEGCAHLLFYTNQTTNSSNHVQNITITKGVNPIKSGVISPLIILIPDLNNEYEMKVARNTSGELKIYCEADLIA